MPNGQATVFPPRMRRDTSRVVERSDVRGMLARKTWMTANEGSPRRTAVSPLTTLLALFAEHETSHSR